MKSLQPRLLAGDIGIVRLETGVRQPEALALYERCGYVRIPPFGGYRDDPPSVFLEKRLARVGPGRRLRSPSAVRQLFARLPALAARTLPRPHRKSGGTVVAAFESSSARGVPRNPTCGTARVSSIQGKPLQAARPFAFVACLLFAVASWAGGAPLIEYRIVAEYPHDAAAFTQGLVYDGGALYESTGLRGRSSLRKVELTTGRVVRQRRLSDRLFGEGLALVGDTLYQLTWTSGRAFVVRLKDFSLVREHRYAGQGWGLAYDGARLVMSDGSATLRFRDPATFRIEREVDVREGARPVEALNELEVADGAVYANVWQSERVARIDPASGAVTGWLDLSPIIARERSAGTADVANGIAWDGRRLFVTGKLWRSVYGLELLR